MKAQFRKTGAAAIIPAILALIGIVYFGTPLSARSAAKAPSAKAKSEDSETTRLHITVTAGKYNKPVDNASVYVRFPEKPGSSKLEELDLKTDENGNVRVPPVPRGKIMIQVVATAWKTFGKWYDLEQPDETVKIQLEDPPHWY